MFTRRAMFGLVAAAVAVAAFGPAAMAQPAGSSPAGLMPMIPAKAVAFIERRGHEAIHDVFLDSNLGKMYSDEAMTQFVQDSRVSVGKLIMRQMFESEDEAAVAKAQETLHELLKPFWYQPAAMFFVLPDKGSAPGMGFICATGKYEKAAKAALEELMKKGVPADGQAGTRQAFTYKKGSVTWQGVVKTSEEYKLPAEADKQAEELRDGKGSIFMATWAAQVLYVATDLAAADAISETLSLDGKGAKGIDGNASLKVIMGKTVLKDWAFRWFVDVDALVKAGSNDETVAAKLKEAGIDNIHGIGGMDGYADKVYTRLTFIDCPKSAGTAMHLFKKGGSYKTALGMIPSSATFMLVGQLDTAVVAKTVVKIAAGATSRPSTQEADKSDSSAMDANTAAMLKNVQALLDASSGNAGLFVTDLQGMAMMFGGGGAPAGIVLEIKDAAKAQAALDELAKMAGGLGGEDAGGKDKTSEYRKITVQQVHPMLQWAMMKDRLVIGASDTAVKAAIDAALDKAGGLPEDGKAAKLAELAGDGGAIFVMDLPAIAKLLWPMLAQIPPQAEFPLRSLPSADKMVRLLGPEVVVFESQDGGLMLKSRGKVPFATTFLLYPAMGFIGFMH